MLVSWLAGSQLATGAGPEPKCGPAPFSYGPGWTELSFLPLLWCVFASCLSGTGTGHEKEARAAGDFLCLPSNPFFIYLSFVLFLPLGDFFFFFTSLVVKTPVKLLRPYLWDRPILWLTGWKLPPIFCTWVSSARCPCLCFASLPLLLLQTVVSL